MLENKVFSADLLSAARGFPQVLAVRLSLFYCNILRLYPRIFHLVRRAPDGNGGLYQLGLAPGKECVARNTALRQKKRPGRTRVFRTLMFFLKVCRASNPQQEDSGLGLRRSNPPIPMLLISRKAEAGSGTAAVVTITVDLETSPV